MTWPEPDASEGRPSWDQDEADSLVGKRIVVGITRLASDCRTVKAQSQYHGTIVSADEADGFKVECEGAFAGRVMTLPADLRAFRYVDADGNKLPSIGEAGQDSSVIANLSIIEPSRS